MRSLLDRFLEKVGACEGTCWLWLASTDKDGYGQIGSGGAQGTMLKAHRVAYEVFVGPIPSGKCVLHRCDNRWCVSPDHLFLGTQKENLLDMKAKGRHLSGERNARASFSATQVGEIRVRLENGDRGDVLAQEFGVSEATISRIKNRKRYA